MANAITNLTHTILAQKALEAFVAALTPLRAFSTNFSEAEAERGDKIKVPFISAQDAAQDFAGAYVIQDADMDGLDISLNQRKYVSWGLTTQELADNPQLTLERFARQKGFQLAKAVLQDVWGLATNANYGAAVFTGGAAGFDADTVADIETACDTSDWPEMERSLILKPAYHGAVVKDNTVQGQLGVEGSGVISDSKVRRLHNFDLYKSNVIPANGENLVGMAVHPDAILIAMRLLVPEDRRNIITFERLSDADTGITIGFREWFDPDNDKVKRVLECSYGRRPGNTAALKRMVSA